MIESLCINLLCLSAALLCYTRFQNYSLIRSISCSCSTCCFGLGFQHQNLQDFIKIIRALIKDIFLGVTSGAESDSASAQALGRRVWGEPRMSPGNTSCQAIQVERDSCDLQQLELWADLTEDTAGDATDLNLMQIRERGRREESSPRLNGDLFFKAQARRKKYRSVKYKGEVAVRQCVANGIVRWIQSTTVWGNCPSFTDAFSSKYFKQFSNFWTQQHNALFQPWNEAYL